MPYFIHSSVNGHLGCSHVSAVGNDSEMNVRVQMSLQDRDFISVGDISSGEIAGSYGHSVSIFWGLSILFCEVDAPIYKSRWSISPCPLCFLLFEIRAGCSCTMAQIVQENKPHTKGIYSGLPSSCLPVTCSGDSHLPDSMFEWHQGLCPVGNPVLGTFWCWWRRMSDIFVC